MSMLGPLSLKKWFATKFEGYQKISTFAAHLQNIVQDICEHQGDECTMAGSSRSMSDTIYDCTSSSSTKGTIELMNQINQLGWHHIVSLTKA